MSSQGTGQQVVYAVVRGRNKRAFLLLVKTLLHLPLERPAELLEPQSQVLGHTGQR